MKAVVFLLFFIIPSSVLSQNLFPNGGFENYNSCPTYTSQLPFCTSWYNGMGSTDFYHCGYYAPSTLGSYGIPKTGDGVIGFIVAPPTIYNSGVWYGEAMKTTLTETLIPGAKYEISADILHNPMYPTPIFSDCFSFGFLFYKSEDNDSFPTTGCISYQPQVRISPSLINFTYTNFKQTIVADSCYDKVMIGFFCNDSTYSNQCMNQDNSFYLDLDNISLEKISDSPNETKGFEASSTKICKNDCISFSDTGTINNYSWKWEFAGSLTTSSTENNPSNICYPTTGLFDVTFISNYECGSDTIYKPSYIEVGDVPSISIVNDSIVSCVGSEVALIANSTNEVIWSNGQTGNMITINKAGTYIATSMNQCGIAADTISKEFENCDCNLYFPKAFTPNGDASNESFKPFVSCVLKSFKLTIRNRWGQELFSTNDPEIAWDGSYNGDACPSDVYVAICTYNGYRDGKLFENKIAKTVTLLR